MVLMNAMIWCAQIGEHQNFLTTTLQYVICVEDNLPQECHYGGDRLYIYVERERKGGREVGLGEIRDGVGR